MWKCLCGTENSDNEKYCASCGTSRQKGYFEKVADAVRKIQADDNSGIEEFYNLTHSWAYAKIKGYVKNESDAEDILHNAYMKAFYSDSGLSSIKEPIAAVKWFSVSIVHDCINFVTRDTGKAGRTLTLDDEDNPISVETDDIASMPDISAEQEFLVNFISNVINNLPEKQKECLILYYFDQYSVDEISQKLGMPAGTVKSNLNYARQKVKTATISEQERSGVRIYAILPLVYFAVRNVLPINATAKKLDNIKQNLFPQQSVLHESDNFEEQNSTGKSSQHKKSKANRKTVQHITKHSSAGLSRTAVIRIASGAAAVLVSSSVAAIYVQNKNSAPAPETVQISETISTTPTATPTETPVITEDPIEITAEPIVEHSNIPVPELYKTVLNAYMDLMNGGSYSLMHSESSDILNGFVAWDESTLSECCFLKTTLGYCLIDLNNDGIDELVICPAESNEYTKGIVYDIFTIQDGVLTRVIAAGEQMQVYLGEDHTIYWQDYSNIVLSDGIFFCPNNMKGKCNYMSLSYTEITADVLA